MTPTEFAHATMLVASLRTRLGHANALATAVTAERDDLAKQLSAHIYALTKSNAQCGEYLRHNEMLRAELDRISAERDAMQTKLNSELVEVRAALAATTKQRDNCRRTLYEWEHADTKPHERVAAEDVADHVVLPVLPLCMTCHGCGFPLRQYGRVFECPNQLCNRINTGALGSLSISPAYGPCKSATPVRHE